MRDGCVLSVKYKCAKYKIECWGAQGEKLQCPLWGDVIASEIYYEELRELKSNLEIEKYDSKIYRIT